MLLGMVVVHWSTFSKWRTSNDTFYCSRNYNRVCGHRKAVASGALYAIFIMKAFCEYNCQVSNLENDAFGNLISPRIGAV